MNKNTEEKKVKLMAFLMSAGLIIGGVDAWYAGYTLGEKKGYKDGHARAFDYIKEMGYKLYNESEINNMINGSRPNEILYKAQPGFVINPDGKTCSLSHDLGIKESYEIMEDETVLFTTVETVAANYDPISKKFVAPEGYELTGTNGNLAVKTTQNVSYFNVNCSQEGGVYKVDEYSVVDAEMIAADFYNPDGTPAFGDVLPYASDGSILVGNKVFKLQDKYFASDKGEYYIVEKQEKMVTNPVKIVDANGLVKYYCPDGGVFEMIDGEYKAVTYIRSEVKGAKADAITDFIKYCYNKGTTPEEQNIYSRVIK